MKHSVKIKQSQSVLSQWKSQAIGLGIEPLEPRVLLSTSTDANGYTLVTADPGSKVIYVSQSTGSDQNSGLNAAAPVASFQRAEALVRNHSSDQLLLKAGDTWHSAFPTWTKSGVSPQHPILVGSYGAGARPLILTGDVLSAFSTDGSTAVDNLVISGLQFESDVRDPTSADFSTNAGHHQDSGLRWYAPTSSLLVQNCSFEYYSDNLDIEGLSGSISGVSLFRIQSLDSYSSSGGTYRSQGLYGYNLNGISITQSLFDHDGWSDAVPNAARSGYDHDIYLSSTVLNASIEDNVIANASNNGLLARGGGDIENNLFLDNPSAISYGASPGSMSAVGGVHGAIVSNVIMGDAALGSLPYGYGITIANTAPGSPTLVADNLFTGDTQQTKPAIELTSESDTKNPGDCVGINDLVIQNNLFNNWYRPLEIDGSLQPGGTGIKALNDVMIEHNSFQDATDYLVRYDAALSTAQITWSQNTYFDNRKGDWFELNGDVLDFGEWKSKVDSTAVAMAATYPNASATQETYDQAISGGSTSVDFLTDERGQFSGNWNPAYIASGVNDYLRAAFGVPTTPVATAVAAAVTSATIAPTDTSEVSALPADDNYTFNVTYQDTQAIDTTGIASGNVLVTGPDDFTQAATLSSMTLSADGKSAIASYCITPPSGQWAGTADGSYSIVMQANQVRNSAGIAVAQGTIGHFNVSLPVIINGTNGNDRISVRLVKSNLVVTVNRTVSTYPTLDVPQLQIFALAGNDIVTVGPHVVPVLIDGGAGNDRLNTTNGNDTLLGGDGNDILSATGGNNILLGGTGNDRLNSGSGPNLLDGGDGNDRLHGGSGDDVLIAGLGSDRLQAGRGSQLLVAADASSQDPNSLALMLSAWANSQPYASRVASLTAANSSASAGSLFSVAGISFTLDSTVDTLIGGSKTDWFLSSLNDIVLHKSVVETNSVLD